MESSEEETLASEFEGIIDQLNLQKRIHESLSKTLAELEAQLETTNKELITSGEDLRKEKTVSSELRNTLIETNNHCTQFFTSYQNRLDTFDHLNLSWLYLGYSENEKPSPQKSFIANRQMTTKVANFSTIHEESDCDGSNNKENESSGFEQ